MLFDGRIIRSVGALLASVTAEQKLKRASTSPLWYRGCTNKDHSLVPSIGRPPFRLEHERPLINAFKQNAVQFLQHRPESEWEWTFLARHHAVPTRLLIWTESPLIGLYFATHSLDAPDETDHEDGALWLLFPTALNEAANINLLDPRALPMFEDDDANLKNYLPGTLALEDQTRLNPVAGIAVRHSKRMQAQHSVFTVTHREQTSIEALTSRGHIGRYIVPAASKKQIRNQLAALQITRLSVFPDLDNAAWLARRPYDG